MKSKILPAAESAEARDVIQNLMGQVTTAVGETKAREDSVTARVQDHHVNHPRKLLMNESRIEALNEDVSKS